MVFNNFLKTTAPTANPQNWAIEQTLRKLPPLPKYKKTLTSSRRWAMTNNFYQIQPKILKQYPTMNDSDQIRTATLLEPLYTQKKGLTDEDVKFAVKQVYAQKQFVDFPDTVSQKLTDIYNALAPGEKKNILSTPNLLNKLGVEDEGLDEDAVREALGAVDRAGIEKIVPESMTLYEALTTPGFMTPYEEYYLKPETKTPLPTPPLTSLPTPPRVVSPVGGYPTPPVSERETYGPFASLTSDKTGISTWFTGDLLTPPAEELPTESNGKKLRYSELKNIMDPLMKEASRVINEYEFKHHEKGDTLNFLEDAGMNREMHKFFADLFGESEDELYDILDGKFNPDSDKYEKLLKRVANKYLVREEGVGNDAKDFKKRMDSIVERAHNIFKSAGQLPLTKNQEESIFPRLLDAGMPLEDIQLLEEMADGDEHLIYGTINRNDKDEAVYKSVVALMFVNKSADQAADESLNNRLSALRGENVGEGRKRKCKCKKRKITYYKCQTYQ